MMDEKKRGVKVCIIDEMDYEDFKKILDAINDIGYNITMVDNGNAVCILKGETE